MMTMKRSGTRRSNASSDARSEANREHLSECFSPVCLNGNRRPPQVPENIGAGEGNRTLVFSLEGCCSTIELHPHIFWSMILSENQYPPRIERRASLSGSCSASDLTRRRGTLNCPRPALNRLVSQAIWLWFGLNARRFAAYIQIPINHERR